MSEYQPVTWRTLQPADTSGIISAMQRNFQVQAEAGKALPSALDQFKKDMTGINEASMYRELSAPGMTPEQQTAIMATYANKIFTPGADAMMNAQKTAAALAATDLQAQLTRLEVAKQRKDAEDRTTILGMYNRLFSPEGTPANLEGAQGTANQSNVPTPTPTVPGAPVANVGQPLANLNAAPAPAPGVQPPVAVVVAPGAGLQPANSSPATAVQPPATNPAVPATTTGAQQLVPAPAAAPATLPVVDPLVLQAATKLATTTATPVVDPVVSGAGLQPTPTTSTAVVQPVSGATGQPANPPAATAQLPVAGVPPVVLGVAGQPNTGVQQAAQAIAAPATPTGTNPATPTDASLVLRADTQLATPTPTATAPAPVQVTAESTARDRLAAAFSEEVVNPIRQTSKKVTKGQVEAVQAALTAAGRKVAVDGILGPETTKAVQAFQKANQLTSDGVFGAATYNALYAALQPKQSVAPVAPVAALAAGTPAAAIAIAPTTPTTPTGTPVAAGTPVNPAAAAAAPVTYVPAIHENQDGMLGHKLGLYSPSNTKTALENQYATRIITNTLSQLKKVDLNSDGAPAAIEAIRTGATDELRAILGSGSPHGTTLTHAIDASVQGKQKVQNTALLTDTANLITKVGKGTPSSQSVQTSITELSALRTRYINSGGEVPKHINNMAATLIVNQVRLAVVEKAKQIDKMSAGEYNSFVLAVNKMVDDNTAGYDQNVRTEIGTRLGGLLNLDYHSKVRERAQELQVRVDTELRGMKAQQAYHLWTREQAQLSNAADMNAVNAARGAALQALYKQGSTAGKAQAILGEYPTISIGSVDSFTDAANTLVSGVDQTILDMQLDVGSAKNVWTNLAVHVPSWSDWGTNTATIRYYPPGKEPVSKKAKDMSQSDMQDFVTYLSTLKPTKTPKK